MLAERAAELCSPYSELTTVEGSPAARLVDRMADLRRTTGAIVAPVPMTTSTRAQLDFVDDASAAGLRFVFDNGQTPRFLMPETNSGGVGLLDFDGDGWLDVYCVQGGR